MDDIERLLDYGRMGLETGQYEQAREDFEQVLTLDPSNREAMKGLARVNEILSRRVAFERIKPEALPAKTASKAHIVAEWIRKKRRAYAEWLRKRERERAERAAEREAILERIRWRKTEGWRSEEWYLADYCIEGNMYCEEPEPDLPDPVIAGALPYY